jgi:signal peptidase I
MSTEDPRPTEKAQQEPEVRSETPLESLASIASVLAIGLFVMAFIFQNFEIPSGSMEKTLLVGDHVLVNRTGFPPPTKWAFFMPYREVHRGDVIVFFKPNPVPPDPPELFLVKRAIGLPGDRIHLRNGILYLNGVAQNEPFAAKPGDTNDPNDAYTPYRDDFPSVPASQGYNLTAEWAEDMPSHIVGEDLVVPPGKVFAMGDHRTQSLDGRFWGFVPRENIVGTPLFVYWSFRTPPEQAEKQGVGERIGFMFHVMLHIFDGTRWTRTLHRIT